ncbi:sodium- and chloride-dependent GABA transporter 2 [Anabrus simplex]|uniref:sodium- and chloride-dependent GABA transporter 2 n=1 Tax=Anabrus simplex TaxID=316456 RepID=UPI0035A39367
MGDGRKYSVASVSVNKNGKDVDHDAVTTSKAGELERIGWASPVEFLLSCLSYAVGLGNVWRFPYLVYRNGGGAFLVPYIIMLFTMGLPIFFLELVMGQYTGQGPNTAFYRMAPIFQGVGYCTLVVIYLITIYYHVITAWTLFYIFHSFTSELGWASCDYDFSTPYCYSESLNRRCLDNSSEGNVTTYFNKTCILVEEVCSSIKGTVLDSYNCLDIHNNTVNLRKILNQKLASEEYYRDYAMGVKGATWENWGELRWEMVGWLFLAWVIAYFCLIKGVQSTGKVVYFTAIFPYIMLTAILIRGATLNGALEGIKFYITPKWEKLLDAQVWGDAASQTFYALGIGCGSLVTLSSYNRFTNNCHRDALFVSVANMLTAIFAGFAVFSILGFMAHELGMEVEDVVDSGPGLAFVAYPEAVLRMPLPQLWSVLFFFMLFILGLGSQFAGVEAVSTSIIDLWPWLRSYKYAVTGAICLSCFLLALPMCFSGGVYLFTLLDWNTAYWAIFILGFVEVVVVSWIYGCERFLDNIGEMTIRLRPAARKYWWVSWVVLAPITLIGVLAFTLYNFTYASFGNYIFPEWVDALGWFIGLSTLIPLPAFAVYRVILGREKGMDLLRPLKEWGPSSSAAPAIPTETTPLEHMYENTAYSGDIMNKP